MNSRRTFLVLFCSSTALFACSGAPDDPQLSGDDASASAEQTLVGACGLSAPAFCETFDTKSPGGRSGDLDERMFGVARVTSKVNPLQAELDAWEPGQAVLCGVSTSGIVPGNDFRVCNGHLEESFNDSGEFAYHSTMIRRPFDFAGRTGTIVFDVDAKSIQHGWWSELWVSDEPVAGPYQDSPGVATFPHNAFGIQILGDWCPGTERAEGAAINSVFVFENYQLVSDNTAGAFTVQDCFAAKDQVLNHFEVHVSKTQIEVFATDAGKTNLRRVAKVEGLQLPFTRGYIHLQHTSYNAVKAGVSSTQTFRWDNVGFDGPTLAEPRVYEVADALDVNALGHTNVGYDLAGLGSRSFSLLGVDTTGAKSASVHLSIGNLDGTKPARFRVNNGAWRDVVVHNPLEYQQGTVHLDVPLSEVASGSNTLTFTNPNASSMVLANLDLTLAVQSP